MNQNKERIIDKVRKAFALSKNNTSIEEAETAMLKAQELMAKHNISIDEVDKDKIEDKKVITADLSEFGRTPYWKKALAKIISDNFRCMSYTATAVGRSKIRVLGLEEDVEIVKEMYKFAVNILEHSVRQYMRNLAFGGGVGVKNDYIIGFINGLKDKFAEQVDRNNWGLMLVKDALVLRQIEEMNFRNTPSSQIQRNRSQDAYASGYGRGKSLQKNKELTGR